MALSIPRILLIDDEPMILELFAEWLQDDGYSVKTASNALEGLTLVAEGGWDLIISDVYLEPLDGFGIADFARRIDRQQQLLLITGRPDDDCLSRAQLLELCVLGKPVSHERLATEVTARLELAFSASRLSRIQKMRQLQPVCEARFQPR